MKSREMIMEKMLKNIDYSKVVTLADAIAFLPGQVISKTLCQTGAVGMTLFAIPAGEGISAHKSSGDAFILILAGKAKITIGEEKFELAQGQSIVMPAGVPHAVNAQENMKMLLVVIFPSLQ